MSNLAADRQSVLSVVGTPIGNLSDASARVIDTLKSSDQILCEDTRVTSKLLAHFDIHVPLVRADENTLSAKIDGIVDDLLGGAHISFVSDAGMPGVSDPGQTLVDAALDKGIKVEVIPGPSAVICALVASGFAMDSFFFGGFLPRKSGPQKKVLEELATVPGALVFYESPRRVVATLENICEVLPQRNVALIRELTKLHEEVVRGKAEELLSILKERDEIKGECVLVISSPTEGELVERKQAQANSTMDLDEAIFEAIQSGENPTIAAKRLARMYGLRKQDVYSRIVASK